MYVCVYIYIKNKRTWKTKSGDSFAREGNYECGCLHNRVLMVDLIFEKIEGEVEEKGGRIKQKNCFFGTEITRRKYVSFFRPEERKY